MIRMPSSIAVLFVAISLMVVGVKSQPVVIGLNESSHVVFFIKLDIVFVLDASGSISRENFGRMKVTVRRSTTHFYRGRVGIVAFASSPKIALNLTRNKTAIERFDVERDFIGTTSRTDLGLAESVKMLADARSNAVKVVILIVDGKPDHVNVPGDGYNITETEALKLKEMGSIIYVVLVNRLDQMQEEDKRHLLEHCSRVAGDGLVVHINIFPELHVIYDRIRDHLRCHYMKVCRFDNDRGTRVCKTIWWRLENSGCNTTRPPTTSELQCEYDDCEELCDAFWKWAPNPCNPNEEREVDINRRDRYPSVPRQQRPFFDTCPSTKKICCGKCPTPSIPPEPSETHRASTPTHDALTEETTTPDAGHSPPLATMTPDVAHSLPLATPTPTPLTTLTTKSTPPLKPTTDDKKDDGINWLIIVLPCAGVLVLLIVIIVIAVVLRKRKTMKTEAMEKKMAEEKKVAELAMKPAKSISSPPGGRTLGVGVKQAGAEHHMGVSLRDTLRSDLRSSSVGKSRATGRQKRGK